MSSHQLNISGMTCAACSGRVERALRKVEGVSLAEVNLATESARIEATPGTELNTLLQAIQKAGYGASVIKPPTPSGPPLWRAFAALALSLPLLLPMLGAPMLPGPVELTLAAIVLFGFGAGFFQGAWKALRHGSATMDVLVVLGTTAAFGLSCWNLWRLGRTAPLYFESTALIIGFVLLGKALEARAKRQTLSAIHALQALQPETARVEREGREQELPLGELRAGDLVIVRPGERMPVDGVVEAGESEANEALITGEAQPVHKPLGARVIGGSINGEGLLHVRCTALGAESALARIARLVEDAQAQKASIQGLVDRICAVFVPAVMGIALLTLLAWGLIGGNGQAALLHAVAVLVIACPCALGLATPAALMAGMGAAARRGILIRDAAVLEAAQAIRVIAFDKTGTLTEGRPRLLYQTGDARTLQLAAALAGASEHPVARAIREAGSELDRPPITQASAKPGRGVTALLEGQALCMGNQRWMIEQGIDLNGLSERAADWQAQGLTVSWVALGSQALGLLAFDDAIKPHAVDAVRHLQARGLHCVLISGDHRAAATAVADQIFIKDVHAEVLPADKAQMIVQLRERYGPVAMVGDGINDAPALAAADLGIAMGSGAEMAMAASGITLMRADPQLVIEALDLAQRTRATLRQNLFWAFAFNGIGIPLAAFGLLQPALAGAAMALSSVTVLGNALLLTRRR